MTAKARALNCDKYAYRENINNICGISNTEGS